MNSVVAYLPLYGRNWYNWLIFFLFSFLSPLSSVYSFLFSHQFPLTDSLSLINCWSWSVIADPSSPISHRSLRASSSSLPIEIDVGIDVEILIMGIDVEVRWDLNRELPVLVGFGCRCKWIRGFRLAMLVVLWVWFPMLVGFGRVFWVWVVVFSKFELLC